MTQPVAAPPTSRPPLVERVAELERLLARLAALHNDFASDVARELGLSDGRHSPA